jgi:hypothetical protein
MHEKSSCEGRADRLKYAVLGEAFLASEACHA